MKRTLLWSLGCVGLLAVGVAALLQAPPVQQKLFEAGVRNAARDSGGLLADDALRVAICGSSAPLPSRNRAKACVAVFAGGQFYLVDVGPESVENLMLWRLPLARIGGVLVTHLHSDHIGELGELNLQTWAQGRPQPLTVHGPPGVETVTDGFNQAYRQDQVFRTAHHGARMMPAATWPLAARPIALVGPPTPRRSRTAVVYDDGKLRITAIEVDHEPAEPAYAYRFDYRGRSVVVSGDTKAHPALAVASRDADVLVSEAMSPPMLETMSDASARSGRTRVAAIMRDVQGYHTSTLDAARTANTARVKLLVLYHLLPAPDNPVSLALFRRGLGEARNGDWLIARDGSLVELPIGSKDIRITRVNRGRGN